MNSLSWFLYLAYIIGNVQGVLVALTILTLVLAVIGALCFAVGDDMYGAKEKAIGQYLRHCWKFCLVFAMVAALIPSRETIYLIAGSEAGEAVVTSQEGQEILNDVKAIIKQQLADMKAQ